MNTSQQELFNSEEARFRTFTNWTLAFLEPKILAMTGFYFIGPTDTVTCYFCHVSIGQWEPEDNEVTEHQRWSINCPLIRRHRTNNIPIDEALLQRTLPPASYDVHGCFDTSIRQNAVRETQLQNVFTSFIKKCSLTETKTQTDKYPQYLNNNDRLKTYKNWPNESGQSPQEMMEAGFFYTAKGDRVKCFSCGIGIKEWNRNNSPWEQHVLLNSSCVYLQACKSPRFIATIIEFHKQDKNQPKGKDSSKQDKKIDLLCKVCYTREYNTVFLPCGHVTACTECAIAVKKCPLCRKDFDRVARVYLS